MSDYLFKSPQRSQDANAELRYAAEKGDEAALEAALEKGASVNSQEDETKTTALHCAAYLGRTNCVRQLLAQGADARIRDSSGRTPILAAVENGRLGAVELLVAQRDAIDLPDDLGDTPLLCSVSVNAVDITKVLLKAGANPNYCDRQGRPAMFSAESGEVARALLAAGADIHQLSEIDTTVLHDTCAEGKVGVLEALLEVEGIDLNPLNRWGSTPLHLALLHREQGAAKMLLRKGALAHIVDAQGRTAEQCMQVEMDEELKALLAEARNSIGRNVKAARR